MSDLIEEGLDKESVTQNRMNESIDTMVDEITRVLSSDNNESADGEERLSLASPVKEQSDNIGTFDANTTDIRYSFKIENGIASYTEKRFDSLIRQYSVIDGSKGGYDYAKAYVSYISPSDFLSLTTRNEDRIVNESREKYTSLDVDTLSNSGGEIYLSVDFDTGEVDGHEGRHRMALLRDAGIKKVAVVIQNSNAYGDAKYHTEKLTGLSLNGQVFNGMKASGNVTLDEVIPLSPRYRNEVR